MKTNVIRCINQPEVYRTSSIVLSEGLMPYRIVLCDLGDKFVTYNERMVVTPTAREDGIIELTCEHLGYDHGHYFDFRPEGKTGFSNWPPRDEARENAVQDFNERCARVRVR